MFITLHPDLENRILKEVPNQKASKIVNKTKNKGKGVLKLPLKANNTLDYNFESEETGSFVQAHENSATYIFNLISISSYYLNVENRICANVFNNMIYSCSNLEY